ncbi:quinone-dependent dihydroorotate dehydrogenase [Halorhabdus amylolytica]|uniref:quinone-dependent dihydroorotate dehydrogenase n=1 Tax=Halorhabdus amylolytica TaxID=2559573 RepID=UPI0010AAFF46|nr:quinone-dependent dihydroorotate dehydrogenase [Halorhabdus amylolytica]
MTLYDIVKPLLFQLSPETAHWLADGGLAVVDGTPIESVLEQAFVVEDDRLRVSAFGETFPNPIGVAAGFDKTAQAPGALQALGFGHVEVGGVTAEPQEGNPRPRVFRLVDDEAIINRMGLNNPGAAVVGRRLAETDVSHPIGVNLGKTEDVAMEEAAADYRETYERVATGGDFFVVNVSCPNSPGIRELQNRESMADIFAELTEAGASPLLVKLSPDLPEPAIEDALELVEEFDLDGVVATNTTTDRPETLTSPDRVEEGGLSGKPLEAEATEMVQFVARRTDVPVIGVGGVFTAADAYRKIRAGASLVQIYTGFIYRGPTIARDVNRGLATLLERDGFDTVEDAVGADL